MEINNLETELKFVNKMGLTLNIEERMKIEMGINLINDKFNLDEVLVWGKIKGVYNDYYIIQGLKIRG
jgi:radial spoke head protein 9